MTVCLSVCRWCRAAVNTGLSFPGEVKTEGPVYSEDVDGATSRWVCAGSRWLLAEYDSERVTDWRGGQGRGAGSGGWRRVGAAGVGWRPTVRHHNTQQLVLGWRSEELMTPHRYNTPRLGG